MAGSANSIVARNVLRGRLSEDNLIAGGVGTAFNPAYALVDEAGNQIVLYINSSNYQFYAELKDKSGNHISNSNIIDLPLESMVVDGSYDAETKEVVLVLNNGNEVRFSVADLVEGLVSTEQLNSILTSYVKFTDYATTSKTGVVRASSAYGTSVGPSDGVMSANVKAYNDYPSSSNNMFISKGTLENVIAGKNLETANNKVTSVSSSSTDTQYPTAKLFYNTQKAQDDEIEELQEDAFGDAETTDSGDLVVLEDTLEGALDIELGGNTSQEAVAAVAGTEVINTNINVNDVDNTKENQIILKGNTSQIQTTQGKNLLPKLVEGTNTFNGKTYSVDSNGVLTMSGTPSAGGAYIINLTKPYTITSETRYLYIFNDFQDATFGIRFMNGNNRLFEIVPYSSTNIIEEISQYSGEQITAIQIYQNLTFTAQRTISPAIYISDTETSFEQFVPNSPSPDYPQDIQVVSGDNNIEICGKNLFDKSKEVNSTFTNSITTALNNYKLTGQYAKGYFDLGTRIANNALYVTPFVPCQSGVTYTINNTYSASANFSMIGFIDDNGNVINHNSLWSSDAYTHTATSKEKYIIFGVQINYNDVDYRDYVQVEKGSTATTYQAYSGNNYSINLPVENLFDSTQGENGYIDDSGNVVLRTYQFASDYIKIAKNTNYIISVNRSVNTIGIAYFDNNKDIILPRIDNNNVSSAIVNSNTASYIRFWINVDGEVALNSTNIANTYNVQMEKGLKANSYTPYGTTPIELCKISDNYQDKIFKSNNEWYLHKETKKIILDGTETGWTAWKSGNLNQWNYYKHYNDLPTDFTNLYCLSDYFTYNATNGDSGPGSFNIGGLTTSKNGNMIFNPFGDTTSDLDGFKTWLSTHNIIVYYPLKTPIDTKITDATLISQLDALYTAQLKNGITNIGTNANDLLPYIDLKYNMIVPSPSPEKPSNIHVVTGNNTITVCGKNLFTTGTVSDYETIDYGNFQIIGETMKGKCTGGGTNYAIKKTKKYTNNITIMANVELNDVSSTTIKPRFLVRAYDNNGNIITNGATGWEYNSYYKAFVKINNIVTFSLPNASYINVGFAFYSEDAGANDYIKYKDIMVSTLNNTTYEPYQSQTYPINLGSTELCKLGSYQDKIIKPSGKNLFDPSSFVTKNNVSMNTNEVLTATSVAGTAWGYSNRNWTGTLSAGIYTLTMSASQVDTDTAASIRVYNSGGNELLNFGYLNNIKNKSMILNLVEETTIGIMFKMSARGIWTFQIEKGPTATEYEPCSISNWFFKKAIYKVIFDGSENWGIATRYDNLTHYFNVNNIVPMPAITTSQITNGEVCNKFTMQNPYTQIGNYFWIFQNAGATVVRIGFDNETITSSADFKTWLSNNNTTCYYPLETTTYTKITDTTLIGQLDAIANARSYKEFTNISQVNTDLPFELAATAFLDTAQGREAEIEQSKQDKLIPGANIKIENNVISAYDVVRTNGADHIYGNKKFEYYPTTNATTPTSNNQLINKGWVDTQLSNKVGFTDYATASTGGVIKQNTNQKFMVDVNGYPYPDVVGYSGYTSMNNYSFISKGTLENVLTNRIGDVETLLETLDTGSGV